MQSEDAMKERPILFSGPMVQALLAETKTQTRRVAKEFAGRDDLDNLRRFPNQNGCPYGGPGDRLWVREAFRFPASLDHLSPSVCGDKALDAGYRTPWAPTQFDADSSRTGEWRGFDTPPEETRLGKLRPGIHMPRWASRITLEITGVRVERLQDISDPDALAEGCSHNDMLHGDRLASVYARLWEKINGPGSWAKNPYVWVVEFKRVQQASSGRPSQLEDAPCSA